MVYPSKGTITVKSVRAVKIGSKQYMDSPKGKSTMW